MLRIAIIFLATTLTFAVGHASPNGAKVKKSSVSRTSVKKALPKLSSVDLSEFKYVDPDGKIPKHVLKRALAYFKKNKNEFTKHNYMAIIDYTQHSSKPRFHIIDMRTGKVESHLTSHGRGSDPKHTGYAKRFSNREGTLASSIGPFRTKGTYPGKHGRSLILDGLEKGINDNAENRRIVIHYAKYVNWGGRSHGCPAIGSQKLMKKVIEQLEGGAFIYAYGGENPALF